VSGMRLAFGVAAALAVVTIAVAARLPRRVTTTGAEPPDGRRLGTGEPVASET
jgi:MFS transporter, DHA2 family, lincomycin resistance protein